MCRVSNDASGAPASHFSLFIVIAVMRIIGVLMPGT